MIQVIEVVVSPTGETKIETKSFAGASCKAASAFLEKALGTTQSDTLTAEFHQSGSAQELNQRQD